MNEARPGPLASRPEPPGLIERLFGALLAWVFRLVRTLIGGFLSVPSQVIQNASRPVEIRRGRPEEVVDVRHAVLRAGRPRESAIFKGDDAPATRHWVAERGGIVIGVVTVVAEAMPDTAGAPEPRPRWQLRGMAVLPEYRASGLGSALLRATHAEVAEPMWCNARAAVVPFYAAHGWRPLGDTFEIPEVGPHLRMWWPGA